MTLSEQSPLLPSVSDGVIATTVVAIAALHLVVFVILLRDHRSLADTVIFGLIVLYVPVAGPIGYLLWRSKEGKPHAGGSSAGQYA